MKILRAHSILEDDFLEGKSNTFFDGFTILVTEDTDAYTTDGELLFKYRKNVIPNELCSTLYDNLKGVATLQRGRAEASGMINTYSYVTSKSTGKTIHQLDSKARSGIVGYYDNKSFFGYKRQEKSHEMCRQTAYTAKHMDRFTKCLKAFEWVDRIYQELLPDYYQCQQNAISGLDPKYRITDTVFTTITVNKNFRTALHKDKGDFKDGFGILTVVSNNDDYTGSYTLFPKYGIAVDCRHGDFIAMDVHEWHCNSEKFGEGDRVSFVYYLREKMLGCCPKDYIE